MVTQTLAALHRLGGAVLMRDLQATFLTTADRLLRDAQAAARRGDCDGVARAAASLRSPAVQFGAERLAALCRRIEADSAMPPSPALAMILTQAEHELAGLARRIQEDTRRMNAAPLRPRLLLVEDNPDNRLLMRAMLDPDYDVHECASGPEALRAVAGRTFDLALLDIALPGMDGMETLARWRADPALPRVPVMALTAHAMSGDRERYLAAGFDGYLSKPIVEERELLDALAALLRANA